jgi:hypothetical protein
MPGKIYLLTDESQLHAMEEAPYDSEKLLQEMLAKYPDFLAGEQINSENPRRWLLVTREMTVKGEEEGSARWSLDHLFLDQDAVPTLVEVKKSSNTDVRRKVIGQMLDYAANGVAYWPVEEIRAKFESRCEKNDEDPDEVLTAFLEEEQEPDAYWMQVKTNLQAGRIRMVFLADSIPAELRRVVEFLNEQMDPAEVLAIEVKQFVGEGMRTLVPKVLGQTETARQKKSPGASSGGKQWDEQTFLETIEERQGGAARNVAAELLRWIPQQGTSLKYGSGDKDVGVVATIQHGRKKFDICRLSLNWGLAIRFHLLQQKPPFHEEALRRQLLTTINEIPGVHLDDDVLTKRARVPFDRLTSPMALEKAKEAITWLIEQVKAETVRS